MLLFAEVMVFLEMFTLLLNSLLLGIQGVVDEKDVKGRRPIHHLWSSDVMIYHHKKQTVLKPVFALGRFEEAP